MSIFFFFFLLNCRSVPPSLRGVSHQWAKKLGDEVPTNYYEKYNYGRAYSTTPSLHYPTILRQPRPAPLPPPIPSALPSPPLLSACSCVIFESLRPPSPVVPPRWKPLIWEGPSSETTSQARATASHVRRLPTTVCRRVCGRGGCSVASLEIFKGEK